MKFIFKSEQEWLGARTSDISATDVSVLFGLNPYKSIKKLIKEKSTKDTTPLNDYMGFMRRGRILEPAVCEAFYDDYKWDVRRLPRGERHYYRLDDCNLAATPDALLYLKDEPKCIVECKTTDLEKISDIWQEEPPIHYALQTQVQIICVRNEDISLWPFGYIGAISGADPVPFVFYKIIHSKKLERIIKDEVNRFWNCLKKNEEFEVNTELSAKVKKLIKASIERQN